MYHEKLGNTENKKMYLQQTLSAMTSWKYVMKLEMKIQFHVTIKTHRRYRNLHTTHSTKESKWALKQS